MKFISKRKRKEFYLAQLEYNHMLTKRNIEDRLIFYTKINLSCLRHGI